LFAWVITEKGTAESRSIEIDPASKDLTVVTSGLTDGERVITAGQYKLKRGAPVAITAPAAAGSGSNS
jgi:multidrug efflux system membrane fusion protein